MKWVLKTCRNTCTQSCTVLVDGLCFLYVFSERYSIVSDIMVSQVSSTSICTCRQRSAFWGTKTVSRGVTRESKSLLRTNCLCSFTKSVISLMSRIQSSLKDFRMSPLRPSCTARLVCLAPWGSWSGSHCKRTPPSPKPAIGQNLRLKEFNYGGQKKEDKHRKSIRH